MPEFVGLVCSYHGRNPGFSQVDSSTKLSKGLPRELDPPKQFNLQREFTRIIRRSDPTAARRRFREFLGCMHSGTVPPTEPLPEEFLDRGRTRRKRGVHVPPTVEAVMAVRRELERNLFVDGLNESIAKRCLEYALRGNTLRVVVYLIILEKPARKVFRKSCQSQGISLWN